LLRVCASFGAGLLVAGAFGHTPVRERGAAGVTRELIGRAPIPVLLMH
jgi:nucleotide-binding universal stress UspA family protein